MELTAHALARRLISAERDAHGRNALASYPAAERVAVILSRSLGPTGLEALLARSLAQGSVQHPVLADLRYSASDTIFLAGTWELAATHGLTAVEAGIEAVLELLLAQLAWLIGIDIVVQLVERDPARGTKEEEDTV